MALEGETIGTGAPSTCPDCGMVLEVKVLVSGGGYYIGTECDCGPYSRESRDYYPSREKAQAALDTNTWVRRDTEFHGGV